MMVMVDLGAPRVQGASRASDWTFVLQIFFFFLIPERSLGATLGVVVVRVIFSFEVLQNWCAWLEGFANIEIPGGQYGISLLGLKTDVLGGGVYLEVLVCMDGSMGEDFLIVKGRRGRWSMMIIKNGDASTGSH